MVPRPSSNIGADGGGESAGGWWWVGCSGMGAGGASQSSRLRHCCSQIEEEEMIEGKEVFSHARLTGSTDQPRWRVDVSYHVSKR